MFNSIDFDKLFDLFVYQPGYPLLFGNGFFLFFFFALLFLFRIFDKSKNTKIFTIIFFSLFFYYKAVGLYFILLIVMTLLNFYAGKWLYEVKSERYKGLLFMFIMIVNLGLLGYFKYTNFFIEIINDIQLGQIDFLDIFLPIGISFYTFKAMSYVIEIHIGTFEPTKSFRDFALFMFFFPNVLMGPIDRASRFIPQIDSDLIVTKADIGKAVFLMLTGLFKKGVIADYISLNFVDRVFDAPLMYTGVENLLAMYGYSMMVYCDFSGYTDMAMAIGLLLGFKLMENFNSPFKAFSVSDYWRRWHLSLSTWLLDYLFKPLQLRFRNLRLLGTSIAIFCTFFIVGLWHGANWTFIFFGILHSIYIVTSTLTQKYRTSFYQKVGLANTKGLKVFQIFVTFHLLMFTAIFFRSPSLEYAYNMFSQIIGFFHYSVFFQFVEGYTSVFIIIVIGYILHYLPSSVGIKTQEFITRIPLIGQAALLALMIWIVIQIRSADIQPFIYFQF